jgi:cytochrome b6-f complex iron-sulfur subunit
MTISSSPNRRDILKTSWAVLGGLAALELGALSTTYMQPRLADGEFGGLITIGSTEDFPPGSVTHIANGRFYLSRMEDGGFLALYQSCTHLSCTVPWEQSANQFVCPCHSSSFNVEGDVLNSPAPRPLDIFAIQIEDGFVKVDTSRPIERDHFDPTQVTYA